MIPIISSATRPSLAFQMVDMVNQSTCFGSSLIIRTLRDQFAQSLSHSHHLFIVGRPSARPIYLICILYLTIFNDFWVHSSQFDLTNINVFQTRAKLCCQITNDIFFIYISLVLFFCLGVLSSFTFEFYTKMFFCCCILTFGHYYKHKSIHIYICYLVNHNSIFKIIKQL